MLTLNAMLFDLQNFKFWMSFININTHIVSLNAFGLAFVLHFIENGSVCS